MSDVPVLSVTELTCCLKEVVEARFPYVWVTGEISNCTRAGSGHVYLTLKDQTAQLRAVMWRNTAQRARFELHDGLQVIAAGPVEVYQPRGTYQLIIDRLLPQGIGALELAFRQMREKLAAQGLFDPARKRPLPRFPRRVALVTSPSGAAVRDLLQVITRRWRAVDIVIVPVPVQGGGAAERIAAGLRAAARLPCVEVIVTGRGGGSLEDLWPFNEEVVARAIYESPIPVVSAVGHEIDVSIADLVADRRALTPSEAGELVVPNQCEVESDLDHLQQRLVNSLRQQLDLARTQLDHLARRRVLTKPLQRIHDLAARLDELELRLKRSICQRTERTHRELAALAGALDALSPLKVLQRGYTLTRRADSGELIRSTNELQPGERITTQFHDGSVTSRVESPGPRSI